MTPPPHAVVVTVSDRSAAGTRPDLSGPTASAALQQAGFTVEIVVVPDGEASVRSCLISVLAHHPALVLTLGGTGIGPHDRTPEGTRPLLERELPGIAEVLRERGRRSIATAALGRGLAGVAGRSLVVNLPGSVGAVTESLEVLLPLLPHAFAQLVGGDH